MEIAKQIVELKRRGYICIQLLKKLTYTNGVTYYFKEGQYITCHKENDPETTIFNSKLKKLGRTRNDSVIVSIKGAAATLSSSSTTDPSTWCVDTAKSDTVNMFIALNTKRVRAVLDASKSGIEIAEYCGIVPVFKYAVPSSEVSHYAVETKKMRDILITSNETKIKSLVEKWMPLLYINGRNEGNGNLTDTQRNIILKNYEIRNTDGAICRVDDKRIIESNTLMLRVTVNGKRIGMRVERHRAYMSTFKMHERRIHQTEIDHIDGNHSNNLPWNLRWVSISENCLAKHSEISKCAVPDQEKLLATHGQPTDPVVWEGWTFHPNMWIKRPDKSQFVKLAKPGKYPVISPTLKDANNTMKTRHIHCHIIVAYVFRARIPISKGTLKYLASVGKSSSYFATSPMTYFEFTKEVKEGGLCIMHADNDKENYNLDNLEIGTPSENQEARQYNPATTDRKRVKIIDVISKKCIWIFGSYAEAATWLGVDQSSISKSVRFNRKTTSKKTGATYYIVDAI